MTVSKALRDTPDISAATKTRLQALAREMGYVPDTMAQSLRTRKTRLLGLVISSFTNPIYLRATLAIEELAFKERYELVLFHTLNEPAREAEAIRRLLARRVDGLLIAPVYRQGSEAPIYRELQDRSVPTVLLGQKASFCDQFVNVECDDQEASAKLTEHLIELGHRRIAFFSGSSFAPWAAARFEGYRRALQKAQIPLDDHLIFKAGSTIEEGELAARQFLNETPQATAIQAVNDFVALGVGRILMSQGVQIPGQISLAGFGDFLAGEFFGVPLTTMHEPKWRLGAAAMETLAGLLRGESRESSTITAELLVRASTTPPSAG